MPPQAVAPRYEDVICTKKNAQYPQVYVRIDSSKTGDITISTKDGGGYSATLSTVQQWDYTKQVGASHDDGEILTTLFTVNVKSKMGTLILVDMSGKMKTYSGYICE